ncbi:MAG: type II secretion system protein [Deltaproteobacteria bacterium]|nr:type II secretion system protein [Deltaproteobacteria bacterium]
MVYVLQSKIKFKKGCDKGFTLIEMAMVMVIAGIIISTIMTVMPAIIKAGKIKQARAMLAKYDYALQGYAITNFRLPFADSSGDGLENNNVFIGDLPYLTLGLSNGNDVWGNRIKYAVYGRTGNPYNLTDTSDKATLCAALSAISGFDSNIVYTTSSNNCAGANAGNSANQAYAVSSGGPKDLDGNNGFFDLCTGTSGAGFNADNKIQALDYDDLVRSFSLVELAQKNCGP